MSVIGCKPVGPLQSVIVLKGHIVLLGSSLLEVVCPVVCVCVLQIIIPHEQNTSNKHQNSLLSLHWLPT